MRTYSISDAARLLGVSAATISRRLPAERATRGRSAHLTVRELTEIAAAMHVDVEAVRRRVDLAADLGPGMPAEAALWAAATMERGLQEALEAHCARIPGDLLIMPRETPEPIELPEPWGDVEDWKPISSETQLHRLLASPAE